MTTSRQVYTGHPSGAVSSTTDAEAVTAFHTTMPGYRVTPLIRAPDIAASLGVADLWVKDESERLGMPAFKILGASWATYRVLCQRVGMSSATGTSLEELRTRLLEYPNLTLVAATDGNHGRAVARIASLLGLQAHILVPRDMVPARIDAIEKEGAKVDVIDGTYDETVAESARLEDETHVVVSDTSWDGYEQVPGWVIDGYSTISQEIRQQLADRNQRLPTVIAVQVGVGAFAASIIRGLASADTTIVSVEPAKAACALASAQAGHIQRVGGSLDSIMAGLNCGAPSPIAWPDLISGVKYFAAVDDSDAEAAIRALSAAGIESGESGAAGLAGLMAFRREIGLKPMDRVLVVSTEGATDPDAYQRILNSPE